MAASHDRHEDAFLYAGTDWRERSPTSGVWILQRIVPSVRIGRTPHFAVKACIDHATSEVSGSSRTRLRSTSRA
jgi:hypothetical protein